jgi:hypothetical protein
MLQKCRYLSWSKQLEKTKQKVCLQYAMWNLAASVSSQFQLLRTELYREARMHLDALEMDNDESGPKCIEQVQAWILLSIYEFSHDYQRGLVSAGRAFRLIQLMRLYEIDGNHTINLQGNWVDIESCRRTFWVAYTIDRFTGVHDNLPLTLNESTVCHVPIYSELLESLRLTLTFSSRSVPACLHLIPNS